MIATKDNTVVEIFLTQGQIALVDAEYVHFVRGYSWCAYFASTLSGGGYYARRGVDSIGKLKRVFMHRFLWEQVHGAIPDGLQIDHISGNTLDNRLRNLRLVTNRGNQHNRKEYRDGTKTSKYVGIYWSKQFSKWQAQIKVNGYNLFLGRFDNEADAGQAYQEALKELVIL